MATGTLTTYDATVGVQLDIEPMIALLDPADVPLLNGYGTDGRSAISKGVAYEKKVEWLDDTLLAPRDLLNGSYATSDAYMTVDNRLKFTTGDIARIDAEYVRITGYGTTDNTLLTTRAFNSSTQVIHADNSIVVGTGTALPEGTDPHEFRFVDRTGRYNVTQIFGPHKVQVSETEAIVRKYGLEGTNEWDYQIQKKLRETAISIEQAILYGTRVEDTSNEWRAMGGFTYYFTTNVDTTTTDITSSNLLTQAQAAYDVGGNVDRLVVGSTQKRKISQFDSTIVRLTLGETRRGQVVSEWQSDFGNMALILDRWCRPSDAFGYDRDQVELKTLRPIHFEMLAKTGDSRKGQVVGEKTLVVRRQSHGFRFSALT